MTKQTEGRRSEIWQSLQTLSQEEGVKRPNIIELLKGELNVLQQVWNVDIDNNSVNEVQRIVAAQLYALVTQLAPREARQQLTVEQRKQQYQYAVSISFNIIIGTPQLRDTKLQRRRSWLASKERGPLRITVTTSQRDLNHAIDKIAEMLTRNDYTPAKEEDCKTVNSLLANDDSQQEILTFNTTYIARNEYHKQIDQAVKDGYRLISLEGAPGVGKTRLAYERLLVMCPSGNDRAIILARSPATLESSLRGELSRRGHTVALLDLQALKNSFAELVCSKDGPKFVLLDNIEESNLLEQLIPPQTEATVLVTSRPHILPENRGTAIEVGTLSSKEADRLVIDALPSASKSHRRQLAKLTGTHPLAIEHICYGLLREGRSWPDVLHALRKSVADTLHDAAKLPERSLTWAYTEILSDLDVKSPQARTILELMSVVHNSPVPVELLQLAWKELTDTAGNRLAFRSAVQELNRRHLISTTADFVSAHILTQRICADLVEDKLIELATAVHSAVRSSFGQEYFDRARIGVELLPVQWFVHLGHALRHLLTLDLTKALDLDLGSSVAAVAHSLREYGPWRRTDVLQDVLQIFGQTWDGYTGTSGKNYLISLLEVLDLEHGQGNVGDEYYAQATLKTAQHVNIDLCDNRERLYVLLKVAKAHTATGNHPDAIRALDGFEHYVNDENAISLRADATVQRAHPRTLLGHWSEATNDYEKAEALYLSMTDEVLAIRGQATALLGLVNVMAHSSNLSKYNEVSNRCVVIHDRLRVDGTLARRVGMLTQARVNHAMAKLQIFGVLEFIYSNPKYSFPEKERLPALKRGIQELGMASTWYETLGAWRDAISAAVDLYRAALTEFYLTQDSVSARHNAIGLGMEYVRGANMRRNSWAGYAISSLLGRFDLLVLGPDDQVRLPVVHKAKERAYLVAARTGDRYLYCELLATACLYSAVVDESSEELLATLHDEYREISRHDRWAAVTAAILCWEEADYEGFRRGVADLMRY